MTGATTDGQGLQPVPPETGPNPPMPADGRPEPFWRRIASAIWGYDFFISYHWASGGRYAVALAQRLRDKKYDCFLDRAEYAMGDDWKKEGQRALRNTRRLVLIATRQAIAESPPVAREVEIFTARSDHIVPIVFGQRFVDADRERFPLLRSIPDSQLAIEELVNNLDEGPSEGVVEQLLRTHRVLRRRVLRARLVTGVIATLATAVVVVGFSWWREQASRRAEAAANVKASRELAVAQWRLGGEGAERHDVIRAGHHYFRAARASLTAGDDDDARNANEAGAHCTREIARTLLHDQSVAGVLTDAEESRLVVWCRDGLVRLWDLRSGERLHDFVHEDVINGASFDAAGERLLTWGSPRTAQIWDVRTGALVRKFDHESDLTGAMFSPGDESGLFTWGTGQDVRMWETSTGKLVKKFEMFDHSVGSVGSVRGVVVDAPRGRLFAWGSHAVIAWDLKSGKELLRTGGVSYAALFPGNPPRYLLCGDQNDLSILDGESFARTTRVTHVPPGEQSVPNEDGSLLLSWYGSRVTLWDLRRGEKVGDFNHTEQVYTCKFIVNSKYFITNSQHYKGSAHLWSRESPFSPIRTFEHGDPCVSVLSGDGARLLTVSRGLVRAWDMASGRLVRELAQNEVLGAAPGTNGSLVLMWAKDGTVRLWDVDQSRSARAHDPDKPSVKRAGFTANGSQLYTLATGGLRLGDVSGGVGLREFEGANAGSVIAAGTRLLSWDPVATLWDLSDQAEPARFAHEQGRVLGVRLNHDSSRLLTWGEDGTVRLWDAATQAEIRRFGQASPSRVFRIWNTSVEQAMFGRNESLVFSWGKNSGVRVWDASDGRLLREVGEAMKIGMTVYGEQPRGVVLSQDGLRLITWGNGRLRSWSVDTGARLWSTDDVLEAVLDPAESLLLAWGAGKNVAKLLDPSDGRVLVSLVHPDDVTAARFNARFTHVLTCSADNITRLWDARSGHLVQEFQHGKARGGRQLTGASLIEDDAKVVTWGRDGLVRFWDTTAGALMHSFDHGVYIEGVDFSRDGSRFLTWGAGKAYVWQMPAPVHASIDSLISAHELTTGTRMDDSGLLRVLTFKEWVDLPRKPIAKWNYRAVPDPR